MPILSYQGIDAEYRDLIQGEDILYADLRQEEQYFRYTEIPFTDDELVDIANREHQYTEAQKKWVAREEWRMDNGVYAMINGVLTFIPGSQYGYVNYWTLENGGRPQYRNITRKVFIIKEYLCFKTKALALLRGKSRRKGATTEGTFWEWWICGRKEEKIGGMVSYNNESVSKIFQMLFMRGFKGMLPCFVADFDSASDNFIRFVKPVEKKKKGVPIKREGLNSYIDYQPTTLNSYDSGRISYLLVDEGGKWEKVDINTYWSKVKPTLTIGTKKVGFAYFPSTVNPKDKGGENFKKLWDLADQNAINPNTGQRYGIDTPMRMVRILDPATEGYEGCIDKFGESVIDDPVKHIMGNDGEWITEGSRTKILKERESILATGDKDRYMEHRRDFPLDEYDLFAFAIGFCEFYEDLLIAQRKWCLDNPDLAYWRRGRFKEKWISDKNLITGEENNRRIIEWMDDPKGPWWVRDFLEPNERNKFTEELGYIQVNNTAMCQAGVDTYKNIFAKQGSKGTVAVLKKPTIDENGKEIGPIPIAIFWDRPDLIGLFNKEVLLGCLYYGCKVNFEIDATLQYYEDFMRWGALDLLVWSPVIDTTKKGTAQIKPGSESASEFVRSRELEVAKIYLNGTSKEVYNGWIKHLTFIPMIDQFLAYNHEERTPYDLVIAVMMALLPILGVTAPPPTEQRKKSIFPEYTLKIV